MHELHRSLCKRSLDYVEAAKHSYEQGLYDVTGLLCQISAELAIKAIMAFLGYSFPETHELRKLLSLLSTLALKEEIDEFVRSRRGDLILLEDRGQRGQYFSYGLDKEDAQVCLNTANDIINLVMKVWGKRCSG